jgi:uncharacterized membrane protein (DUF2068 family)
MKREAKKAKSFHRWELIGCALHGHETFQSMGSSKANQLAKQLSSNTELGLAWRCLRCGNFIVGTPKHRTSLKYAPLVLRGKVLRQLFILRLLASERFLRGLFLTLLGIGILKFKTTQGSLSKLLNDNLPALHNVANSIGYDLDSSETLKVIRDALNIGQRALTLAAVGAFVYAGLQFLESIGLWRMKRWGEYFSAVATAIFIPLEVYEIYHHTTAFKLVTLSINILAVLYLVLSTRRFGFRGGREAYDEELESENLLEIERVND